jgi:tight adherence protein B
VTAARRSLLLLAGVLAAFLLPLGPASAEDGTIAHVESSGDGLKILVNVPPGVDVELDGVEATLDGDELEATATSAGSGTDIKRTTILAIDTSQSMRVAGRFAAAKTAAKTYLDSVPEDVEVGVVVFDNDVSVAFEPSTDREAARGVVDGLELARDTRLYDGIMAAVQAAGTEGQRTVLVLSDGADTGGTSTLADVTDELGSTNTLLDVVSLGQTGNALARLRTMTEAGNGRVIESTGTDLAEAFRAEADVLAAQVLVSAPLPAEFDATQATVEVTLPTLGEPVVARALAPIQAASAPAEVIPQSGPLETPGNWSAPRWVLYGGLGALALGLLTVAVLLVPRRPGPMSIAERVEAYSTQTRGPDDKDRGRPASEPVLEQAKAAAAGVLERNTGLNERLTTRLTAAGSEFRPSEWLLVHIGVVLIAGLLGLLVGGGDLIVGLLFVVLGTFVPPLYLRIRASRRNRAFQEGLPDVLQLLAGALSAGLSLAQAVDTVVREGPEPIASEFKRVLVEARIGVSLEDAFEGVANRFQSKDFAWAVMAIRIQRQVGGNLAELLTTVGATMRERASLRRHVIALSGEGRMSAMILCGLPPVFFLYLFVTNREFLEPLYADPRGWIISAFGVTWLAIGVFWMSRMVKVDF